MISKIKKEGENEWKKDRKKNRLRVRYPQRVCKMYVKKH